MDERSLQARSKRDRLVRRILWFEGSVNAGVVVAKVAVGLSTGSFAVLGEAIHSLADVANNIVALVVVRIAARPADREHPYGHRKFETLAVFGLATLLTVLAVELGTRAIEGSAGTVSTHGWTLGVMLGVLGVNVALAGWQGWWARRLRSEILRADARHTLGDVLATSAVIGGWQAAAHGYAWLDPAVAVAVAGVVLWLAFDLFKRSIPALVDRIALDPEELRSSVQEVGGVRSVRAVRSRWIGTAAAVDVTVTVAADLPTFEAHAIADGIERVVQDRFDVEDVTVHIEPHEPRSPRAGRSVKRA